MRIVALAAGVCGAKLVDGLSQILPAEDLTVIVNTGDDFHHWGLKICPDLDTVCYTVAGLANPEQISSAKASNLLFDGGFNELPENLFQN